MLLNRVILPIFLLAGISFGQGYGSIKGTLTDEGGMAISGATVYAMGIGRPTASAIPTAETDAETGLLIPSDNVSNLVADLP